MSNKETAHDETHETMVRWLVENSLVGEEKRQAEQLLFSCDECLTEYNSYRDWWESITQQESTLPHRRVDTPPGQGSAAIWWRRLAFAGAALLLLAIPIVAYRWRAIQPMVHQDRDTNREVLEKLRQEQARVQDLNRTVGDLSQTIQKQTGIIAERSQRLDRYIRPSANAFLEVQVVSRRELRSADRVEIQWPNDKLFLHLVIQDPEGMTDTSYKASLLDSRGATVWQDDSLRKGTYGSFDISIGKDFFKDRDYLLKIHPFNRPSSVLTVAFRIRAEP